MILETLGHLAAYALFVGACIGLFVIGLLIPTIDAWIADEEADDPGAGGAR